MSVELLVNIIVILLLIPTIIFALLLNKRLEILRNSRADLGRLIEAFNDATTRAEAGIPRLKQAADSAGAQLKEQIRRAQTLHDDIAFMLERAENVVSKLDSEVTRPPVRDRLFEKSAEKRFEKNMEKREEQKPRPRRALVESPEDLISSAVSAAEDILRDADGKTAKKRPVFGGTDDGDGDRSEAERELLKALQSMR
ncbi:MAG TPA: hypothetical protein DD624_00455 [Alphaproteobacteria bacterium]|nr:hypothetical protein [Alphaproteobacteria bacterium]